MRMRMRSADERLDGIGLASSLLSSSEVGAAEKEGVGLFRVVLSKKTKTLQNRALLMAQLLTPFGMHGPAPLPPPHRQSLPSLLYSRRPDATPDQVAQQCKHILPHPLDLSLPRMRCPRSRRLCPKQRAARRSSRSSSSTCSPCSPGTSGW
ncbi:hypothetical protein BJV74DRAFT_66516 [Russula compacta]|nr:hypothetical protein BJV74DRAFT_66516 [Russula compacta]